MTSSASASDIKYKWIVHAHAVTEWRPMLARLRTKAAEKKVAMVLEAAFVEKQMAVEPKAFVPYVAPIGILTDAEKQTWLFDEKTREAEEKAWRQWKADITLVEQSCAVATSILMEMFHESSMIATLAEDVVKGPAGEPEGVTRWLYLWAKLWELFSPKQAVDRWRIYKEWIALTDQGITFTVFHMKWDRFMLDLDLLGVKPSEADQEGQLANVLTNPVMREKLRDVQIESITVPVPNPRVNDVKWFWKTTLAICAVQPDIDTWGERNVALWAKPAATSGETTDKKRKADSQGSGKGAGAGQGGKQGGGNWDSKAGGKNKTPRGNGPGTTSARRPEGCWQCGRTGHRYREQGKITCTATTCSICKKSISPTVLHDTTKCAKLKETETAAALAAGITGRLFMKDGELWQEGNGTIGTRPFR